MKAYQRIIREKKSQKKPKGLFGKWWENIDLSLKNAKVKKIKYITAKNIIKEYEWLGCMPAVVWFCYGIFFEGNCGGAVVFGPEYSENTGVWDKYDYTGKMTLLSRGACAHWTPKNTASKLIMGAIKQLPQKYKIITATVDKAAGEVGIIYQACNFYYVGSMRENNPNVKSSNKDRFGVKIDNKIYGSRSIRQKIGNQKKENILKHFPNAKFVKQHSKHRYFYFKGTKKEKKYYKSKIKNLIKPYPKRGSFCE